jgi:hypothetical protein
MTRDVAAGAGSSQVLLTSCGMVAKVYVGNAAADAPADRGWLLGHFRPADDARHSDDVEIKWGMHPRGERRARWVIGETRTAMIVLVSGRFRVELPGRSVLLARQGDYVVFHGVDHSWQAEEESVVLGVRWPSVPGYAVHDGPPADSAQLRSRRRDARAGHIGSWCGEEPARSLVVRGIGNVAASLRDRPYQALAAQHLDRPAGGPA